MPKTKSKSKSEKKPSTTKEDSESDAYDNEAQRTASTKKPDDKKSKPPKKPESAKKKSSTTDVENSKSLQKKDKEMKKEIDKDKENKSKPKKEDKKLKKNNSRCNDSSSKSMTLKKQSSNKDLVEKPTKSEISIENAATANKADESDVYDNQDVSLNAATANKADESDVYDNQDVSLKFAAANKADESDVYDNHDVSFAKNDTTCDNTIAPAVPLAPDTSFLKNKIQPKPLFQHTKSTDNPVQSHARGFNSKAPVTHALIMNELTTKLKIRSQKNSQDIETEPRSAVEPKYNTAPKPFGKKIIDVPEPDDDDTYDTLANKSPNQNINDGSTFQDPTANDISVFNDEEETYDAADTQEKNCQDIETEPRSSVGPEINAAHVEMRNKFAPALQQCDDDDEETYDTVVIQKQSQYVPVEESDSEENVYDSVVRV